MSKSRQQARFRRMWDIDNFTAYEQMLAVEHAECQVILATLPEQERMFIIRKQMDGYIGFLRSFQKAHGLGLSAVHAATVANMVDGPDDTRFAEIAT